MEILIETADRQDWGGTSHPLRPLELSTVTAPVLTAGAVVAGVITAAAFSAGVASDAVESVTDTSVPAVGLVPEQMSAESLLSARVARLAR